MTTDKVAESPDEQALRIAVESGFCSDVMTVDNVKRAESIVKFARRLRAELSEGQEPAIKVSDVRAMLEAGKVAGKDYLYFFKPSEIEAWFRAALIAQAPVAQDGYVMVPRELLVTAIKFMDAAIDEVDTDTIRGGLWHAEIQCSRLLAASPSPTTPDQDAVEATK